MAEGSSYDLGLPGNVPESVKARLMAARLLAQSAAQQTAPYTSKGVVGLKAIEGLMGGLQERSAINEAQQRQADQRRMSDEAWAAVKREHAALIQAAGAERFVLDRLCLDGDAPLRCEVERVREALKRVANL